MTDILKGIGAWWNGFGALDDNLPAEVARAQAAKLDYIVIKYGCPAVEFAFRDGGIVWGTEMFVQRGSYVDAGTRLGDAVDAGAAFVVLNCESGGGWDGSPGAGIDMVALVAQIKARHPDVPLYGCIDTRGGRTTYPYEVELINHADGIMPMAYPGEFYPSHPAGYVHSAIGDAMAPLAAPMRVNRHPVLQAYPFDPLGSMGGGDVLAEIQEAAHYRPASLSFYTIGHATDEEWQQVVNLRRVMEMGNPAAALAAVVMAFARVGGAIARGEAAASITPTDRAIVKYIAALLP